MGVYVDDLTIAAANVDTLARFKTEMSKRYEMKDLGELHFILGLQVKRDRSARTLHLSQKQYINTVLERFDMLGCKPAKSPLRSKTVMSLRKEGEEKADQARYLAAVGSLMYAMLGTRPDLAYPVGLLGRFASDPSVTHWDGVLSVFKYLKHTSDLGITYSGGCEQLDGYSDADFATSDVDRRQVTSGYVFRLWGGAISWQSKTAIGLARYGRCRICCPRSGRSRVDVVTIDHDRAWIQSKANLSLYTATTRLRSRSPKILLAILEQSRSISGSTI